MRRFVPVLLLLGLAGSAEARGLLIPAEKKLPPLAMLSHQVQINIEDQVAVTRVEQVFRNHTDRQLEATYVFPVPKGASVQKFLMWVDGKELPGELVEAAKARQIYTDIVQRTLDPGLLEQIGNDLLQLKVFPIPPRKDQKVVVQFTSVAAADSGVVEYVYPLKTDAKATSTLEKFAIDLHLKSQHPLQNIYSPTHQITMTRPNDREARISFEKNQALLDRDFQLFYRIGDKTRDVGLTALTHRPIASADGYFMLLVSPRAELSKDQQIPRDFIFVLDTSGSMRGKRMTQARNALKYCLQNLHARDRFAIINFATTVNKYTENLLPADEDQLKQARKWVDALEATGGTAINDALLAALAMRTADEARTFTIVFFTDGQPTIGPTNVHTIQKNVLAKNTANTRIFTFGVGDDVNASFLDQIAEQSRALSTYVRESEDIEAKVSGLYSKISNPVLANLKLAVGPAVKISEVYPPQLPDLFHGNQLVVLGRYSGKGHAAVTLTGQVGKERREFVYELNFSEKTTENKEFVEDLWARRKVGYLLDQIRLNGEKKELIDEVVILAKRYGITTPYTSYLIVPDAPVPVAARATKPKAKPDGKPNVAFDLSSGNMAPAALQKGPGGGGQMPVTDFLKQSQAPPGSSGGTFPNMGMNLPGMGMPGMNPYGAFTGGAYGNGYGGFGYYRFGYAQQALDKVKEADAKDVYGQALLQAKNQFGYNNGAYLNLSQGKKDEVQAGKLGVDLSCDANQLRSQTQLSQTAVRRIGSTTCLEVGGVWVDEAFDPKMKTVTIKAMSPAYFQLLEQQPSARAVL
ncbi:MAG TPA: VIT domain-containing protein, partial [Gemmataceae bacterium]|nr:VIT domain-containing protein [Gemmataceae bacterium]